MGIKILDKINAEQTAKLAEKNFPAFRTGDIVRVSIKIKEGDKFRVQDFEGRVLAIDNGRTNVSGNFTVSRESYGVRVEKLFPQGCEALAVVAHEALHGAHVLLAQGGPQDRQEVTHDEARLVRAARQAED